MMPQLNNHEQYIEVDKFFLYFLQIFISDDFVMNKESFAQRLKNLGKVYPNIVFLYAGIGYCGLALLQICFKYVTTVISPFQALFMRSFCLFCLNLLILKQVNESPYIKNPYIFRQNLKRVLFSSSFAVIIHYCVKYLPISTVTTLSNTGPIFIFFIEAVYYKKPLKKMSLAFTVFSFIGVLMIMQPQFLFHNNVQRVEDFKFLCMLVVIAAFCFAMTMIYIHDLAKSISAVVNLHYSYMSHMILTSLLANLHPPEIKFDQITVSIVIAFICLVLLALIAQYMIFTSTSMIEPSKTMPFGYLGIIVGFVADIFYFKVEFDFISILGIFLTSIGLLSKLILEKVQNKQIKQPIKTPQQKRQQSRIIRQEQMQRF